MDNKEANLSTIGKIIEKRIFIIRNVKVMIDSDLAQLYDVETRILNRNVQRNLSRFPDDFMFQLNEQEWLNLRSQFGISSLKYGGRRFLPFAFTEGGVAMFSSVLNSERAIQTNVVIIRTFIEMREALSGNSQLLKKLELLVKRVDTHDLQLQQVFQAMRDLIAPTLNPKRPIGIRSK